MSLKSRFKTDPTVANDGVWVDFAAHPNKDGSIPGFLLARASKQNKKYTAAVRELTRDAVIGPDGMPDTSAIDDNALADIFARTVVMGWRNFQPNDDGVNLEFSVDTAKAIFLDPAWTDLYDDLVEKAKSAANYREKNLEGAAKNS